MIISFQRADRILSVFMVSDYMNMIINIDNLDNQLVVITFIPYVPVFLLIQFHGDEACDRRLV